MFAHESFVKKGLYEKMKDLASRRTLNDLTNSPIISWTNDEIKNHIDKVLKIEGSRLLFGGKPLKDHKIPSC